MLYNFNVRSLLIITVFFGSLVTSTSMHASWLKSSKAERNLRIAGHSVKIAAGAILAGYSLYDIDKKFNKGLLNGIMTIIKNTADPKAYPAISASVAAGICIYSGIKGLQQELK